MVARDEQYGRIHELIKENAELKAQRFEPSIRLASTLAEENAELKELLREALRAIQRAEPYPYDFERRITEALGTRE